MKKVYSSSSAYHQELIDSVLEPP